MSYITSWTDSICTMPPGNYDETSFTTALNSLIHLVDPSITATIDASKILKIKVNDYYRSFRIYTDYEVINKSIL